MRAQGTGSEDLPELRGALLKNLAREIKVGRMHRLSNRRRRINGDGHPENAVHVRERRHGGLSFLSKFDKFLAAHAGVPHYLPQ